MKISIRVSGEKYDFDLLADDDGDQSGFFELGACHKGDGRQSGITNINKVISEFIRPIMGENECPEDTHYIVHNKKKFEKLVIHTIKLLRNHDWLVRHLEPALDQDKENGEWTL
jgi:hypothetical protein